MELDHTYAYNFGEKNGSITTDNAKEELPKCRETNVFYRHAFSRIIQRICDKWKRRFERRRLEYGQITLADMSSIHP